MKVGDYVRFKTLSREIKIGKVIEIIEPDKESMKKYCVYDLDNNEATVDDYIIKSSPNIIDLIELGDLVRLFMENDIDKEDTNVFEVVAINDDKKEIGVFTGDFEIEFFPIENLRGIVTKEQFESMKYKV